MDVEPSLRRRAAVHASLGEPARLAIADALALGDAAPGELATALGLPSNLLAHHLGVLESAGIVERTRSEADRRRTYVRLRSVAYQLVQPRPIGDVPRVVFVCTHNSARSQLAAAVWPRFTAVPAASAGTHPAHRVHPRAAGVARRHGFEIRSARTAHVADVARAGDLVVAVCDRAYEELGRTADAVDVDLHWSVPDPALSDTDDAFSAAFDNVAKRVRRLAETMTTDINEETV
jgi:ArsR family transcriptional regulator, arsenate/arsenite/antimonite-responsive transcriptional repressor / arsenate reductase (thioredoxin)